MATNVRDNPDQHRYELHEDGAFAAFVTYRRHGGVVDLLHTETLDGFTGRGLADRLVRTTLDEVRAAGDAVRPSCPYVRDWIGKHPAYVELVPEAERARFQLTVTPPGD